jgi:malate synthase
VTAADLLDVAATPGSRTEAGLRNNISVGVRYLESWLRGAGAVGIDNLMEDAATAEIARSQVFQWVAAGAMLDDGRPVTADLVRAVVAEELDRIRAAVGVAAFDSGPWKEAADLFDQTALGEPPSESGGGQGEAALGRRKAAGSEARKHFVEFLTLPAYERLD